MARARRAVRGGALDFLRFLASLLIVLYHFGAESPMRIERFHQVFSRGFLATDFFLILSGYVLGRAYGASTLSGKITPARFWLRRAARVWPGHLMVLAAMAVLVLVLNAIGTDAHKPSRFAWDQLPVQALLVHAWGVPSDGWNLPSWSLSALIVCYAIFPFMWRAADKVRHAMILPLVGAATIIVQLISTSIWTCCTSLVMRVMSDGAPKWATSWVEKPVTWWNSPPRTSRPKLIAALAAKYVAPMAKLTCTRVTSSITPPVFQM